MKYGLLMHKSTKNLGDDIQSYAIDCFLPKVDYYLTREHLDVFKPEEEEPIAVVMSAWWMWEKWNWPPSKYIIPKFVGFHYSDNYKAKQAGCPVDYDFLTGLGADYLNAYGPIGARDTFTENKLKDNNVDSYFSGCITITLPEQKKRETLNEYICLVDVDERVKEQIIEELKDTNIEIKIMTHNIDYSKDHSTWEKRKEYVEDVLEIYQNAKCVVTRRLHCALPCLAMGVKTLLVIHTLESIRFIPYYDWLHVCTPDMYLEGECDYDLVNPPQNKDTYKKYAEEIEDEINSFVTENQNNDGTLEDSILTNYTEEEKLTWRLEKMEKTIVSWIKIMNKDRRRIRKLGPNYSFFNEIFHKQYCEDISLEDLRNGEMNIKDYLQIMEMSNDEIPSDNREELLKQMRKALRIMLSIARKDFQTIKELNS